MSDSFQFKLERYGTVFPKFIDPERLNELGTGRKNDTLYRELSSIDLENAFAPKIIKDIDFANACWAAIWLHHDFLEESHELSQEIPSSTGSFWHGIMHRREGDYWNSKYWFKRVLDHGIYPFLNNYAQKLIETYKREREFETIYGKSFWDPFKFVDLTERFIDTNKEPELICKKIQRFEWQLLFHYSYCKALGKLDTKLFP
jgi:hypothetical protein